MSNPQSTLEICERYLFDLTKAIESLDTTSIVSAVELIHKTHSTRHSIYVCGNGGSASTASHLACDLGKNVVAKTRERLRIVSLNDNVAHFSAIANDLGYDQVFAEQMHNLVKEGDLIIAISASGNSPNIVLAAQLAKELGASVIGMTGFGGGTLAGMCDVSVHVPINEYGPVEDLHLVVNHIFTLALQALLGNASLSSL